MFLGLFNYLPKPCHSFHPCVKGFYCRIGLTESFQMDEVVIRPSRRFILICLEKLFLHQLPMPTFAAVIGWSRLSGTIKMGSPVKIRRYPRSCKEASTLYLWSKQPLSRLRRTGRCSKFRARRPAITRSQHFASGEKQG
jgi:hypothetical protein